MNQLCANTCSYPRRLVRFNTPAVATAIAIAILAWFSGAVVSEPNDDDSCIAIWRYRGNIASSHGLELAIWKDGTILVAANERSSPGERILVGKVETRDIDEALGRIREAGFFDKWDSPAVVDAAFTVIHVNAGGKAATVARTETLMPGVGVNVSADPKSRALVRMWRRTRGAIEFISPIELSRLEEKVAATGKFRGYNLADPVKTSWRPNQ
jgi:hypothetical protein